MYGLRKKYPIKRLYRSIFKIPVTLSLMIPWVGDNYFPDLYSINKHIYDIYDNFNIILIWVLIVSNDIMHWLPQMGSKLFGMG